MANRAAALWQNCVSAFTTVFSVPFFFLSFCESPPAEPDPFQERFQWQKNPPSPSVFCLPSPILLLLLHVLGIPP